MRGERYTIVFTNPTNEVCTLGGPIELTATDGSDPPTTIVDERSPEAGPTILALPDVDWAAKVTINVYSVAGGAVLPGHFPSVSADRWPPTSSCRGPARKAGSRSLVRHKGGPGSATLRSPRSLDPWPFW